MSYTDVRELVPSDEDMFVRLDDACRGFLREADIGPFNEDRRKACVAFSAGFLAGHSAAMDWAQAAVEKMKERS